MGKIRRTEFTFGSFFKGLLKDPENSDSGFKETPPPHLEITPKGELVGKERCEPRTSIQGIIFLHPSASKVIRVAARDLSPSGVGINIDKLKSYRIGSKLGLEFAEPHKLQGLMIKVELRRVNKDSEGKDQVGFRIVGSNSMHIKKRLREYLNYLKNSDPWAV
jgi:hypothetical protein